MNVARYGPFSMRIHHTGIHNILLWFAPDMGISYADWGLVIVSMTDGVAELYYYDGLHIPAVSLHMHAHARLFDDGAICVYANDQVIKFDICDCCDIAKYCNNTEMLYLCEVHRCSSVKYVKFYGFVVVLGVLYLKSH